MTNRELNLAICKEIEQVAMKIWERVKEKMVEGTYTANQVSEEQGRFGNLDMEMATVEVGDFRCEFPVCESFRLLHQFYRLCSVKDKERKRFTYMKEKEVVLDAEVVIEKQHKVLEKMVDDDGLREIMMFTYLDVKRSLIVASDGKVLGAFHTSITVNSGNTEGVPLPMKMVTKPGTYHVTAYGDGSCLAVGEGVTYSCKIDYGQRYPNYISVLDSNNLSLERHYCVTADGVNTIGRFFKSLQRVPGNGFRYRGKKAHNVRLYARNGEQVIHVQYKDDYFQNELACDIPLVKPCRSDLYIMLQAENMIQTMPAWNGSFWYQDMARSITMDSDTEDAMLMMPCEDNDPLFVTSSNRDGETMVKWDERYSGNAKSSKHRNVEAPKRDAEAPKQKQSKSTFNFMKFYTIGQLASGTYEVRGEKQELLDRDIRLMGRYLQDHPVMLRKSQEYFKSKFGQGEECRKYFPLGCEELCDTLQSALLTCNMELDEIRELYDEPSDVNAESPKQEVTLETHDDDAQPELAIDRKVEVIGCKFYPLLILKQGDTEVRVAGNALCQAISGKDGTIDPRYMDLFNSIDAFITDKLLLGDPLDEQAICQEVEEFFDMLEEVERMNQYTIN